MNAQRLKQFWIGRDKDLAVIFPHSSISFDGILLKSIVLLTPSQEYISLRGFLLMYSTYRKEGGVLVPRRDWPWSFWGTMTNLCKHNQSDQIMFPHVPGASIPSWVWAISFGGLTCCSSKWCRLLACFAEKHVMERNERWAWHRRHGLDVGFCSFKAFTVASAHFPSLIFSVSCKMPSPTHDL